MPAGEFDKTEILCELRNPALEPVVLADELGNEGVLRPLIEFLRRIKLLDDTIIKDRDAVRHCQRLTLVMCDVDECQAHVLVNVLHLDLHLLAQLLVESAQRLVHEDDLGLEHESTRQGDALLLTTGELCRPAPLESREFHHGEGIGDLLLSGGLFNLVALQGKLEILVNRHVGKQGVVLENHTDIPLVRRHQAQRAPIEHNVAMGGRLEPGEHHECRRLARPGRS